MTGYQQIKRNGHSFIAPLPPSSATAKTTPNTQFLTTMNPRSKNNHLNGGDLLLKLDGGPFSITYFFRDQYFQNKKLVTLGQLTYAWCTNQKQLCTLEATLFLLVI